MQKNTTEQVKKEPREKFIEVGERFKVNFSGYTHEGLAIAKIDKICYNILNM